MRARRGGVPREGFGVGRGVGLETAAPDSPPSTLPGCWRPLPATSPSPRPATARRCSTSRRTTSTWSSPRAEHFESRTTVRFRSGAGRTFLELDGELLEGDVDGTPLTQQGNRLPLDLEAGEHVATVVARCRTTTEGVGLVRSVDPADGAVYVYGQSFLDDAQRIFACFDQPDLKATFTLTVDAPEGWVVRGNTTAIEPRRAGTTCSSRPSGCRRTSSRVVGGPWHGETARPRRPRPRGLVPRLARAALRGRRDPAVTRSASTSSSRSSAGRCPSDGPTTRSSSPTSTPGRWRTPALVTFADEFFVRRSRDHAGERRLRAQVIAHELAHMWFGNLVTMRWWDDLWLNEAFAEYMGLHTVEQATEYDGAWADFALARKAWGYRADSLPTTHPIAGTVPDNRAALLNFDGISYAKGASALRQLSAWLGEDTFFAGVRRYLDRHAWGNTSLADLLTALEEESGRDLDAWSRSWLRDVRHLHAPGARRAARQRRRPAAPAWASDGTPARPLRLVEQVDVELPGLGRADRARRPGAAQRRRPDLRQGAPRRALAGDGAHVAAHPRRPARPVAGVGLAVGHRPRRRAVAGRLRRDRCWPTSRARRTPTWSAPCSPRPAPRPCCWAGSAELERRCTRTTLAVPVETEPGSDLQLVLPRAALATARGRRAAARRADRGRGAALASAAPARRARPGRPRPSSRRRTTHGADVDARSSDHLAYAQAALPDADRKAAAWAELTGTGELPNSRGPVARRGLLAARPGRAAGGVRRPLSSPTCPASGGAGAPSRPQS